jgi:hypothetical protein
MTYPPEQPQQPGSWPDPSWSPQPQAPQPYQEPYGAVPGGVPGPGYPAYPPNYGYGYGVPARTNTLAITSLVLSLVGLGCGILAPAGAIVGHVAKRQIRERGEAGDGLALAGIIVGWIVTGLYLVYIAIVIVALVAGMDSGATTN